jgi:uncharacterized membrane protein
MRLPSTATALAALLVGAGVTHFVKPTFFDPIVPHWMPGAARFWTHASGVAEVVSGVALAVPRTRRLGGWLAAATFVAVYPANVQAVIDGGMGHVDPPFNSRTAAIIRLPLQFPLIWWAVKVARSRD